MNIKNSLTKVLLYFCFVFAISAVSAAESGENGNKRPNILLIVVDDMGFSDLGSFGSEINTPNLDTLAQQGIRFTNLHSAPTCSPTRTMMLSGVDHHYSGMGTMSEDITPGQLGKPGYEGHLNNRIVPFPQLLRDAGYHTYMAGKWHLGGEPDQAPSAKGFERSFVLVEGGAGHLSNLAIIGPGDATYLEDGRPASIPQDFYSSRFYTEKMVGYIEEQQADNKPFFAYMAYTAPHWPLQAPVASIERQAHRYDAGYEKLYQTRLNKLVELRLINEATAKLAEKSFTPSWASLSEKERKVEVRKMEIYAAMVSDIDIYVGKLLEYLDSRNLSDNTVVIFISDNGAEGSELGQNWPALVEYVASCCDNSYENMGAKDSYLFYGPNWARAGSGAVSRVKGSTFEGGIRVPGFVSFPDSHGAGEIVDTYFSVLDIMPTILEISNVEHPGNTYDGNTIRAMQGKSWLPLLREGQSLIEAGFDERTMAWELFGHRAVRRGDWKLVSDFSVTGVSWKLYNLADDPMERRDLSTEETDIALELEQFWIEYSEENGVVLPDYSVVY